MPIDKSKWNKNITVSQSTIDTIKKQGMNAALKKAANSSDASYVEGVKRLYGSNRLGSATTVAKNTNTRESRPTSAASNSVSTGSRSRATDVNKAKVAAAARTKAKSPTPKAMENVNKRESRPTTGSSAPAPRGTFPKTSSEMNANKRESRPTKAAAQRKVAGSQTRSYTGYPGKPAPSRRSW